MFGFSSTQKILLYCTLTCMFFQWEIRCHLILVFLLCFTWVNLRFYLYNCFCSLFIFFNPFFKKWPTWGSMTYMRFTALIKFGKCPVIFPSFFSLSPFNDFSLADSYFVYIKMLQVSPSLLISIFPLFLIPCTLFCIVSITQSSSSLSFFLLYSLFCLLHDLCVFQLNYCSFHL